MVVERHDEFSLPELTFDSYRIRDDLEAYLGKTKTEITLDKIAFSRTHRCYCIVLSSDRILSAKQADRLKNGIIKEIPELSDFRIIIRQPSELITDDPVQFEKTLKEAVISREKSLIPFIKDARAELKGRDVYITFNRSLGPSFAEAFGIKDYLEEYFREIFSLDVLVREYKVDENLTMLPESAPDIEIREKTPEEKQQKKAPETKKTAPPVQRPAESTGKVYTVPSKRGTRNSHPDFL